MLIIGVTSPICKFTALLFDCVIARFLEWRFADVYIYIYIYVLKRKLPRIEKHFVLYIKDKCVGIYCPLINDRIEWTQA